MFAQASMKLKNKIRKKRALRRQQEQLVSANYPEAHLQQPLVKLEQEVFSGTNIVTVRRRR